ncbi:MAG: hypothetical protein ACKVTZ_07105 [Bacteroidia bacterium]
MELKINIGYNELVALIKQLSIQELFRLQADLPKIIAQDTSKSKAKTLRELLLHGPIMTNEQYKNYQSNRKWMNGATKHNPFRYLSHQ